MTRPNILWITLDSVRFDHTTLSNYSKNTTPQIKQIAQSSKGAQASHCISHSEWTRSSVASILTGVYPENHMVGMKPNQAIPDSIQPVAERFRNAGYKTACLSDNNLIGPEFGFTRGFDRDARIGLTMKSLPRTIRQSPKAFARYLAHIRQYSGGFTIDGNKHSTSYLASDLAQRWMREYNTGDQPFFMYLHLNDPHRPYYPPKKFPKEFTPDLEMSLDEAGEFSLSVHDNLYEIVANGCELSRDEWTALKTMYDGEIAHTDWHIGKIFDFVRTELGDTKIVITSDHGELFGEFDLLAHKIVLHDAIVRVPLVTYGIESLQHRSEKQVQHIDLMKTLLKRVDGNTDGIQGYDLRNDSRQYAISQRGAMGYERDIKEFKSYNSDFDANRFHNGLLTALRTTEEKLLSSDSSVELVELEDELKHVSEKRPERTDVLESELQQWKAESVHKPRTTSAQMTDELDQHLSDLGYLT